MKTYQFFHAVTGVILQRAQTLSDSQLEANTPAGYIAIPTTGGVLDPVSQRINIATGEVINFVPDRPEDTEMVTYTWQDATKRWEPTPTVKALKLSASSDIDTAAGSARLRYITDVPGQQGVYLQKAAEAKAFKDAGYAGDVPPYIAAEAAATGMTPQEAADRILAIAAQWGNELSPFIERVRISGKQAVDAATDADSVAAARSAALDSLRGI